MTFRITREQAAQQLGISTRTIDRYIKSGKLAYKKIANKILLDEKDIQSMQHDFNALHHNPTTEIVNDGPGHAATSSLATNAKLEKIIDEKIDKFFLVFQEKDRMLEEKNKVIFMLQQRVSELENKIGTMVALPDYNEQKQLATIEKTKLEDKIKQLSSAVRGERTKNSMLLVIFVVAIVFAVFWYLSFVKGWLSF
ncbi:Helix-turn-helix domain protein [candidate division SR1 bacterium Aalborg_AAW-1]|nr:Helix-turn-helix domain protein [candidate division SR1 bacterium Aalborg_AAW-1]